MVDALISNGTWTLTHPSSHDIVDCKWIFRYKQNSDRSINGYKAWLVAQEFHQPPEIDYSDTFIPIVNQQKNALYLR